MEKRTIQASMLDLNNPAYLKIHLLSDGLKLNQSFFDYFDDSYQGSPYHYSKDNKFEGNYPHHMILPMNTVCAINLDEKSPFELKANKDKFFITLDGREVVDVNFAKKYPYLEESIGDEVVAKDVGFVTTPHSLNIFIGKSCFFFEVGQPCRFCGFNPTRSKVKDKEEKLNPENLKKLINLVKSYDTKINQIYFVGATYEDFDEGYKEVIDLVKATKEVAPDSWDVIVTNFPCNDLNLIKELKEAGADRLSFAIEVANPDLFAKLCPGKSSYYGHDKFVETAIEATKHFPRAVYLSMIQGLDEKDDLIKFMWDVSKHGITPTMNIYYNSPYSRMSGERERPSVEYLYEVTKNHQDLFAKLNTKLFSYGADRHCLDWEAYRQLL